MSTDKGQSLSGTPVPIGTLVRLAIVLRDSVTHTAFSNDALPLEPPSLADFPTGHEAVLGFESSSGSLEMAATLTSLTSSNVPVPEQIEALADTVAALESDGTINGGQANSLRQKFEQAFARVADGQSGPAANVLNAFINQINAYVRSGRITSADGEALIAAADAIISALLAES